MKYLFQTLFFTLFSNYLFSQNILLNGKVDPSFVNSEKVIYYKYDSKKLNAKEAIKILDTVIDNNKFYYYKLSINLKNKKKLYFNNNFNNNDNRCLHSIDLIKLKNLVKKERLTTIYSDIIIDNDCQERMYNLNEESQKIANKYTGIYKYSESGIKKEIVLNQMYDSYYSSNFIDENFMNSANGKWIFDKKNNLIKIFMNYEVNKEIGIKKMLFTNKVIEIKIKENQENEEFSINGIKVIKS